MDTSFNVSPAEIDSFLNLMWGKAMNFWVGTSGTLSRTAIGFLIFAPLGAQASIPDVIGSYVGEYTVTASHCTDPTKDGQHTGSTIVNVTTQDDQGNISGTFKDIRVSKDYGTFTATVSGTGALTVTSIDEPYFGVRTQTRYFNTGTVTSSTMTLNKFDFTSRSTGCQVAYDTATVTLTKGGNVFASESASSNLVNTPEKLKSAVVAISTQVSKRIKNIMRKAIAPQLFSATDNSLRFNVGTSAGDDVGPIGVWGSYSYSNLSHDHVSALFDGDSHSMMGGVDYFPTDSVLVGASFGYEMASIDTQFNRGGIETEGFTLAPYVGVSISDTVYADLTLGYSSLEYDQHRVSTITGARVTSDPGSERMFANININTDIPITEVVVVSGRGGVLWAEETTDAFRESDGTVNSEVKTNLTQLQLGGEVIYQANSDWQLFGNLGYNKDVSSSDSPFIVGAASQPFQDDDEWVLGIGARAEIDDAISVGAELNQVLDRKDYDEFNLTIDVRAVF